MNESLYEAMIQKVLRFAEQDERIIGLTLGGSYVTREMDEYSDLDFVVVIKSESYEQVMRDRFTIVEGFGKLLAAFSGEHVGEPRLIICLYNSPALHVDFKFVAIGDAGKRVENPIVLYQADSCLSEAFSREEAKFPIPDLQWIEDRFWVWIHYAAAKIGRGELFEAVDFLSFLRQTVISPLILMKNGKPPRGVRKVETDAPNDIEALVKTIAIHEKNSCVKAVQACVDLYIPLRKYHAQQGFSKRIEAEKVAITFLDEVSRQRT